MKKTVSLLAVLALAFCVSSTAFASDYKGKVEKVDGKIVTIKITKGKASNLSEGDEVEIEAKGKKPKKSGGAALMGC